MTDRLCEKADLVFNLGALFGPLLHLVTHPDRYDGQEWAQTIARYCAEYPALIADFEAFSLGEPGHNYRVETHKFRYALQQIENELAFGVRQLPEVVTTELAVARAAIDAIPVPKSDVILEARTPFSTYCRLRSLCEADASSQLVWIDPYIDSGVFHRFIFGVRDQVKVVLVAATPKPVATKREQMRWDGFLDVSRLYAQERGSDKYRLVVHSGLLHDRWLVLDEKRLFALGGSAKDAGNKQYFTIASLDASQHNLQQIQRHLTTGQEYFGPNQTTHL